MYLPRVVEATYSKKASNSIFQRRRVASGIKTAQRGIPVVGVDPGKTGGISVIQPDGTLTCIGMPEDHNDIVYIFLQLRQDGISHAYIEQVIKYAGNGGTQSSGVTYGFNAGICYGALSAAKFSTTILNPRLWMSSFTDKTATLMGRPAWKNYLARIARELYPEQKFTLAEADSVLIAHYGYQQLNKEERTTRKD